MVTYDEYVKSAKHIETVATEILQQIAEKLFEEEQGYEIYSELPDKTSTQSYEFGSFSVDLHPHRRDIENPLYNDIPVTVNDIAATPSDFSNMADELYAKRDEIVGEYSHMRNQPDHPGKPPIPKQTFDDVITKMESHLEILCADPMLEDLLNAISDRNYMLAGRFLDLEPSQLFQPGAGHELSGLFTNGEINIVYQDRDIALLKPSYNHDITEQVLNDRRPDWQQIRITGPVPEEAYVVGIDDTPTGLFGHSVDGTNLSVDQSVTREMVHEAMGFDDNISNDAELLDPEPGTRIRLQGDLAVEYHGNTDINTQTGQCNIPIDNHLSMLDNATLAPGENREQEPIQVDVEHFAPLNVLHDEHDNIAVELVQGKWEFYLLPRGLQPADSRPQWN